MVTFPALYLSDSQPFFPETPRCSARSIKALGKQDTYLYLAARDDFSCLPKIC
jgi:hypothetical protein